MDASAKHGGKVFGANYMSRKGGVHGADESSIGLTGAAKHVPCTSKTQKHVANDNPRGEPLNSSKSGLQPGRWDDYEAV